MSNTFSFSRLGKLIVKQLFENSRLYLFSALALLGLLALIFVFWISANYPRYHEEETYIIYLVGLFIAGTIFASMSFNMLGAKDKAIYWMSIPATHLEKLITVFFFHGILFTAVYTICFIIVKAIVITAISGHVDTSGATYKALAFGDHGFSEVSKYFIYAFIAIQSLYILGSAYFSKYSFIITTVIGSALIFAFGYYLYKIQPLAHGNWQITSMSKYDTSLGDNHYEYALSPWIQSTLKNILFFGWAPVFWVVSWFRLKEKQI